MGIFSNLFSKSSSYSSDDKKRSHHGSQYYKRTKASKGSRLKSMFSKSNHSKSYKKRYKSRSRSWWS